jgi:hypothetical protein
MHSDYQEVSAMASIIRWCLGVATLCTWLALPAPVHAQVKPGDEITPQNANLVKDLVSPGTFHSVKGGMHMKIVPTQRVEWPPPYREATEKYSSQVRLSQDRRSVVGYVAGQPFPLLDPNDPDIATKIMWNNAFRPITSDDYDLRFFDCDVQYLNGKGKIRYTQVGHYAGYSNVGRTEVEPIPFDPAFKSSKIMYYFALYPVLAPQDWRGIGFVRYRHMDNLGDDIWVYGGTRSRRVRRINEGIMSSATSGTFDPDHYSGFNPKLEQYDYKYLGEKEMLASVHAESSPARKCPFDNNSSICPENWEMRHIYAVQATPRGGAASQALHSKTIVYHDAEMWINPYVDTYDHKGELWQVQIFWLTYRDRPVPDAKVAIYPFKREFIVASARVDIQSDFVGVCYLPGHNTPERECWYINMGAVDREFFTVQAMVKAGH